MIRLNNQHAIAVGEEAVFFFDGFGVGLEDEVAVRKGGDEHDQGALREVEVGEEGVDDFKLVGRVDENIGFSVRFLKFCAVACEAFEHSGAGGASGDDAAGGVLFGGIDAGGCFSAE